VPFVIAETSFDPAFASDTYSYTVIDEIFEAPLTYDMLARPYKLRLQTAESMPEVTEGGRIYTVRLKKGLYFADDPAFNGARRELHARDYEYAIKRLIDPKIASPNAWLVEGRIEGIDAAAAEAKKAGLDYDKPIPGIEVLDAHTIRFRLAKPTTTSSTSSHSGRWAPRPGKWWSATAATSAPIPWAPGPSCSRNGAGPRASCSSATRASARSTSRPSRRRTIRFPSASRAR
jgi:ABC-type transport system substrate-binding protein